MLYSELVNSPEKIDRVIDAYINKHWEDVLADLQTLIAIPSFREDSKANPQKNAPFGPGPRRALDAALEIAGRMGFKTHDVDGYIGIIRAKKPPQMQALLTRRGRAMSARRAQWAPRMQTRAGVLAQTSARAQKPDAAKSASSAMWTLFLRVLVGM